MKFFRFFVPKNKRGFADLRPAKAFIPQWYKDAENTFIGGHGRKELGLKACMPYLDSLTSGYMLTTPVDIYINEEASELDYLFHNNESKLSIRWNGPNEFAGLIKERPKASGATMARPAGHYPNHMIFEGFWSFKTPRGYSTLMTQPLNRFDLPFTIASGIIDSDKFNAPGNIPFFVKKGFVGVVPAGTPIAQLIPIKRDAWQIMENDPGLAEKDIIQGSSVRNKETNYKKAMWQRKKYE